MRWKASLLLVLHYPFADMRGLLGPNCGRLSRPAWPLANPGKDFIRSSGLVKHRLRGGVAGWAGEEVYSDASRALRFPNHLSQIQLGAGAVKGTVQRSYRRFLSDGTMARVEVGLGCNITWSHSPGTTFEWVTFLRDALKITMQVRDDKNKTHAIKLVEAGETLAKHYLAATTDRKLAPSVKPEPWWFCSGTPVLIIVDSQALTWSGKRPDLVLPPHTQHVLDVAEADAELSHTWLQVDNQRCTVWFIRTNKKPDSVRRLRMHLARLHAERECLKQVLLHIVNNDKFDLANNPARSDVVQQYLNDALRALQTPKRHGWNQSVMLEAASVALGVAFEGQEESLKLMRRQVAAKIEGFIRREENTATVINNIQGDVMNTNIQLGNINVTGDFNMVTAKNIQNSFNKATDADIDAELKEKLKALAVEVTNLVKALPDEDAERVSKDFETLTSEAVSNEPRKEWYELSAKGIIEAAKTVADMAKPISTAVKAVLALLAV